MKRILPATIVVVAMLVSGVVHGLWTDRWALPGGAAESAARLENVAKTLGDWQGRDLEVDPRQVGPVAGCLYRCYVNQRTGDSVSVALVCGRPGPVSVHTPDVCYVASGYATTPVRQYSPQLDPSLPAAEFKTAQFVKTRAAEQSQLRVFWSWNAAGTWAVPDDPRVAFAHQPLLYKLYLVRELSTPGEPLEEDPCQELLQLLLPELQRSVISPSS